LDRDQDFWHSQNSSQKYANDFSNIGGYQIANKLLCVVVDASSLLKEERLSVCFNRVKEEKEKRTTSTEDTIVAKLSSARIILEAALATAVPSNSHNFRIRYLVKEMRNLMYKPDPIAMPISAFFRAGASLTPSPVIATTSLFS